MSNEVLASIFSFRDKLKVDKVTVYTFEHCFSQFCFVYGIISNVQQSLQLGFIFFELTFFTYLEALFFNMKHYEPERIDLICQVLIDLHYCFDFFTTVSIWFYSFYLLQTGVLITIVRYRWLPIFVSLKEAFTNDNETSIPVIVDSAVSSYVEVFFLWLEL